MFVTLALDRGKLSASRSCSFIPGKDPLIPTEEKTWRRETSLDHAWIRNLDRPARSLCVKTCDNQEWKLNRVSCR